MSCFDEAPEFIGEDNRRFRSWNPVSKEQMEAKHASLLPADLLKDKTVLDLGCCLGTTGHWCLSNGAKHYTGVELQSGYVELAERLLDKYHPGKFKIEQKSIEEWLASNTEQYDIVCLLGVIFSFTDYFSILKGCTKACRETFAFEGTLPGTMAKVIDFCGVQFSDEQTINLADSNASVIGRGIRISPKGMEWILAEFGFASPNGVIFPPIAGSSGNTVDVYNRPKQSGAHLVVRYLMLFTRTTAKTLRSVSQDLVQGDMQTKPW